MRNDQHDSVTEDRCNVLPVEEFRYIYDVGTRLAK